MPSGRKLAFLLLALFLVCAGCGDEETTDDGDTNNGGATNNGSTNNGGTNNGGTNNGGTNNGGTNNGGTNNGGTNNGGTNNGTNQYTAYEFSCEQATPNGTLADAAGTWTVESICAGMNPFSELKTVCPEAVVTDFGQSNAGGIVNVEEPYVSARFTGDVTTDIFVPSECKSFGGGTCSGLADTVEAAGDDITAECVDENADDCMCTVSGSLELFAAGVVDSVADGTGTFHSFDGSTPTSEAFAFSASGSEFDLSFVESNAFGMVEAGQAASACEKYCMSWMSICNSVSDIETYAGYDECLTTCGTFAEAGMSTMSGDSVECRLAHVRLASDGRDDTNRSTHCPHAQATPTSPCID